MISAGNIPPALEQAANDLARIHGQDDGVVGWGIGDNCLHVYFKDVESMKTSTIPGELSGFPVVKTVTGEIVAL